jgi:hypothetical protein
MLTVSTSLPYADVDMVNISREIKKHWSDSPPLAATGFLMLAALLASIAKIFLDHRIITGVPAWLKPAKFAISTAIYAITIAWLFRYLTVWHRFTKAMGWFLAATLTLEVAIIDIQAARGTTSHFNASTPLDFALFGIMGTAIALLWLASVGILVALFRQQFANRAWGLALRSGMLITVLGSAAGGLMLRTTHEQVEQLARHQKVMAFGGHTVGAPDGGPGLPGVGWSKQHGDLRIPHFFGLHAIQIIPLFAWAILRRRSQSTRHKTRLIATTAASYAFLIAILTWQALRGQSIVEPDRTTLAAMGLWIAGTMALAVFLSRPFLGESNVPNSAVLS